MKNINSSDIDDSPKHNAFFISIEGIDGSGKSTNVEFIRKYLQDNGCEVIVTREPGGTPIGEQIRQLLLNSKSMDSITELLLMFASRQELISNVIVPNLKKGISVIADRFTDSSIAYQGGGRNIGVDKVAKLFSLLVPNITPKLTFLFDVPLEIAVKRVNNHKTKDRIENEPVDFFKRVQDVYYKIAEEEPTRVKVIQTNQSIPQTQAIIVSYLNDLLRHS